jgi:hypothetical protein
MSLPTSIPSNGADRRSTAAPYAFPHTGNAPADRAFDSARVKVGPYVPEPWRGTPAVDSGRAVTPLSVAPLFETPRFETPRFETPLVETARFATPRPVTPIVVEAMAAPEMPPSYPTPAYFTPLVSQAQDDVVASAFELPGLVEETDGRAEWASAPPPASVEPVAPMLPWIEAFLSSTPAMPMRAIDERIDETLVAATASFTPASPEAIVEEAIIEEAAAALWPMPAAPEAPTPSDAWALDEAAEQMRALADELREQHGVAHDAGEAARLFDETASPDLLSAWSDDDMIDIMPMQNERSVAPNRLPTPGPISAIEPWADRARRSGDENAETAARALEVLARRVRDGEISLTGYEPRLGDAAALAAALAALLGVRR